MLEEDWDCMIEIGVRDVVKEEYERKHHTYTFLIFATSFPELHSFKHEDKEATNLRSTLPAAFGVDAHNQKLNLKVYSQSTIIISSLTGPQLPIHEPQIPIPNRKDSH